MTFCKFCILDLPKIADKSDMVNKVYSCMPTVFRNIFFFWGRELLRLPSSVILCVIRVRVIQVLLLLFQVTVLPPKSDSDIAFCL